VSDAADTSVLRARGLRKEYGKGEGIGAGRRRGRSRHRHGRDRRGDGAQRLREVHAPAPARRAGPALRWRGVVERPSHRRHRREGPGPDAADCGRLRLPGLPPDGGAHRHRERRAARAAGRTLAAGGQTACGGSAGAGRTHRPGAVPARGAVRRPAAARRYRPGVEQRTVGRSRRRTDWQSGQRCHPGVLQRFESLHESGRRWLSSPTMRGSRPPRTG
jgi:hypothetical protein